MNFSRHRWVQVSAIHYLVLFVISQLNHHLAQWSIHLTVTGMMITFSAMELKYLKGLLSLLPIAIYLDVKWDFPFGSSSFVVLGLHLFLMILRFRLRRESMFLNANIAIAANLLVFLLYKLVELYSFGSMHLNFTTFFVNLIASSLVIALIYAFFTALQLQVLSWFGIRIREEQRTAR